MGAINPTAALPGDFVIPVSVWGPETGKKSASLEVMRQDQHKRLHGPTVSRHDTEFVDRECISLERLWLADLANQNILRSLHVRINGIKSIGDQNAGLGIGIVRALQRNKARPETEYF